MNDHRKSVTARYLGPKARRRLYEAGVAVLLVAVGYGLMSDEQAYLWAGVLVPILGVARDNVAD